MFVTSGCDLLENLYLCGSNNNIQAGNVIHFAVVICLKICTFAVATTTVLKCKEVLFGCDLLENLYLCGSNNNVLLLSVTLQTVVICLKICTFAVATTTYPHMNGLTACCDLLENLYLCGSNNNDSTDLNRTTAVVICLKICTFAVATTTIAPTLTARPPL